MTTHIPRPGDWNILGIINKHLTWLAIKPQAQVFVFGCHQHLETYHFEKGARISIMSNENGQELHVEPENALIKRTAAA
ncbi:MAG: hypothetical protein GKS07_11345 [Nitrosopumilus sp.]|nr:MAG: hypothetical protein GKS07_00200 [Nitrosopumilus sp.]QMU55429.1 MAG: hypothetical protein GKS07_11345 [Nitrosopumilus sp.]